VPALNVRQMGAWLPTQGGGFYNASQDGVAFDNDLGESVVQLTLDLRNRLGAPPAGSASDAFLQGRVSIISANMVSISNFSLPSLRPPFDWSVMAYPKGPRGARRSTATFVNMDVVPKQARHKDLAYAWLTYYAGLEMARNRMRLIGRVNPRKDFYNTPEFKTAATSTPQLARIPEMAAVGNAVPFIRLSDLTRDVEPVLIETGEGKRSPKQGLADAARLANQILSRPAQ
jgi:ABC-type glycerol-3-phosphate transport system substrate-binding protein